MGTGNTKLEKAITLPEHERFYGLDNFGNTCYCNSVLQALFFCSPFRDRLIEHFQQQSDADKNSEHLLNALADLFITIQQQKKQVGRLSPRKFVDRLRKESGIVKNFIFC